MSIHLLATIPECWETRVR